MNDPAVPSTPLTPAAPLPPGATETDARLMRRALSLARRAAAAGEVPVGAVVYRTADGGVLGEAHNLRESLKDPAAHAELLAIREAAFTLGDWRLNDCTLLVTLEPCPMCAGLIVNARLGRVLFGCADPKAGACGSLMNITTDTRLNHRTPPIGGLLGEESSSLLKAFFQTRRAANP